MPHVRVRGQPPDQLLISPTKGWYNTTSERCTTPALIEGIITTIILIYQKRYSYSSNGIFWRDPRCESGAEGGLHSTIIQWRRTRYTRLRIYNNIRCRIWPRSMDVRR